VKQGIGFRNILDRVQNAADPTEFERMQRRVGEVEKANVTLGRQNADLHRENTQLRALNDKCSILRAFSRAAQAARREISGIGRRIKEGGGRGVYQGSLV
ncbi:MAG TPA: hypothetical protein VMV79_05905, partial [Alphaproteobacteria bacterium]|nr:hypothetical protein [Alphaproteobacteria bacterium]